MKAAILALLLAFGATAHAATIAQVIAADEAIAQAREARKAAIKSLSKLDKAQLRYIQAERALAKAKQAK